MDIEHIRENIAVLQDDIDHLEQRLRRADPDSPEGESIDRVVNVKWRLLSEQRDLLARMQSNAAREAAEDRWRYHEREDTLDLY
jgi:hypothetical protein